MKTINQLFLLLLLSVTIIASSPPMFSYQGYLTDINGNPVNENKSVTFSIYNSENQTTPLWQEIHLITPDQFGQFTVLLGSQIELNTSIFNGLVKYLGIKIENNPEMKPRQMINSVPYAINSNTPDNSITSEKILDNTILLTDINQNNAVVGQTIKWDGTKWTTADDLTGTDNRGNIITLIAGAGLSGGGSTDTINLSIETESITGQMIKNNAITNEDISSNAQIDISKISGAATLESNQIFNGANTFNESIDAFQGVTQNYALKAENNYGGYGIVCNTNSDTNPALKVTNGVSEFYQGENINGTGPLIEAWRTITIASPPSTIHEKRFAVENNGDVISKGTFTGEGTEFSQYIQVDDIQNYETGDLLIIDTNYSNQFIISSDSNSTFVVGVYSSNPAFISSDENNISSNKIPLALAGIVLCKVSNENGAIFVGDLLVSSRTPGHAMKHSSPKAGTIIGKALEDSDAISGMINIFLTLQ